MWIIDRHRIDIVINLAIIRVFSPQVEVPLIDEVYTLVDLDSVRLDKQEYYGTPSWETINFHIRYKATKNIDILGAVDNIFDQHYKMFASAISAPGRNFSVTILGSF